MKLYFINETPTGSLAVATRPRGGDWLEDDLWAAKRDGVTHVVSMLTPSETAELCLEGEAEAAIQVGIQFLNISSTRSLCSRDSSFF